MALLPVPRLADHAPPVATGTAPAPDVLVVEAEGHDGLTHLERVVGLLRGRRHPVDGLRSRLDAGRAVVVVWGENLHGGDAEALVVRRLARLPGVLAVRLGDARDVSA